MSKKKQPRLVDFKEQISDDFQSTFMAQGLDTLVNMLTPADIEPVTAIINKYVTCELEFYKQGTFKCGDKDIYHVRAVRYL